MKRKPKTNGLANFKIKEVRRLSINGNIGDEFGECDPLATDNHLLSSDAGEISQITNEHHLYTLQEREPSTSRIMYESEQPK